VPIDPRRSAIPPATWRELEAERVVRLGEQLVEPVAAGQRRKPLFSSIEGKLDWRPCLVMSRSALSAAASDWLHGAIDPGPAHGSPQKDSGLISIVE
jgi:hypothetical protein